MAVKKTNEVKKEIEATELKAKNAVKAAAAKAKAAEQKAEKAVKTTAAKTKAAAKKTATKIEEKGKAKAKKTEFVIQSPMGGEITTDEIMKKVPKDAEYIYVRVDQNKIWWTRCEESGSVDIW